MNGLVMAAQLIAGLSILVALHELGHFLAARAFGIRVEKFYLFFDPWFSLYKKKIGETVYGIGWLPLGGYVKIAGMVDESMDKEALKQPPQPWEFRSKPAWQRLIIMLAGVTVNVLLAFIIYAMILMVWGEQKIPNNTIKEGVWVTDSLLYDIGMRNGDKILAVNDKEVKYFEDIPKRILFSGGSTLKVSRGGKDTTIDIPIAIIGKLVEKKRAKVPLLRKRVPAYIGDFDPKDTTTAQKFGFRYWDKVVKVDSVPVEFMDQFTSYLDQKKNQKVSVTVMRNNEPVQLTVSVNDEGRIGINSLTENQYDSMGVFKIERKTYGFFEAFPAGFNLAINSLKDYIDQFKLIFKPSTGAYKGVGGFKTMGSIFSGDGWDWQSFWSITAFFSIILAFMNLLPIPALDGGHALFTIGEMITGRKPNEKLLEYAQIAGMVILLALMLYANGNDWFGWGKGK